MVWLKKHWTGLLLGLFAIAWLWVRQGRNRMHERAHYTIGYLTGSHPTPKSGIYYNFRFAVAGAEYVGSSPGEGGMKTPDGTRCVVKYDSIDPNTNVGYFRTVIPDSIRRAPANGWREPPFDVPRWMLERAKKRK
jgi:hypothetical protein